MAHDQNIEKLVAAVSDPGVKVPTYETTSLVHEMKRKNLQAAQEAIKSEVGRVRAEVNRSIQQLEEALANLGREVKQLDLKLATASTRPAEPSGELVELITRDAGFAGLRSTGRGRLVLNVPNLLTRAAVLASSLGYPSGSIMPAFRDKEIKPAGMRRFRVADLLRKIEVSEGAVEFVRITNYSQAGVQTEGQAKTEATINFQAVAERLKTVAHWIPVSKQALSDLAGLREAIEVHLVAGLMDQLDAQILAGSGTGEDLNGLITQADTFDSSLLGSYYTYADCIARAIQQVTTSRHQPDAIVLNPADFWTIRLARDEQGQYVFGPPTDMPEPRLFGLGVAITDAMAQGYFLVGDFAGGAALYTKQDGGLIEISDSHGDYFVKNLLAIRCELRVALAVYQPKAFVYGSFQQSV